MPEPPRRHSRPAEAEVFEDPKRIAEAETRNALQQFDEGIAIVRSYTEYAEKRPFRLRPSLILGLHRAALRGISSYAGNYRPGDVKIENSRHQPPPAHLVPELIEDFCDYVNEHWETATAFHLASYAMWRINWIHPFADGNGRTSRIVSYILLCIKLGYVIPGTKTIPDQITSNRDPYFHALEAADSAWEDGRVDLSEMEKLMQALLASQVYSVVEDAGRTASGP
ncbi:MAG: Fic family protein [Alphaproteobacteria bacterium]